VVCRRTSKNRARVRLLISGAAVALLGYAENSFDRRTCSPPCKNLKNMQSNLQRPNYYLCRTSRCWLAIAFVCLAISPSHGQDELPVLKTNSPNIKIIDGSNASRGDWILDPSIELDVYYAIRSEKNRTIIFKSDIDSRSFEVEPGHVYDFVILLNGKDACKTRISTMLQGFQRIEKSAETEPLEIQSNMACSI
jgi:hypothetical protein